MDTVRDHFVKRDETGTEKSIAYSHSNVGLKKVDHIEIKSGMLFTRDWGEQGKG
jgi:hypothetical protein